MAERVTYTIGIDLGTAYTRAGVFTGDRWLLFSDEKGRNAVPSCVAFTNSGAVVGDAALKLAEKIPTNTVFDILQLLGRRYSDPVLQADKKLWPFEIVPSQDDRAMIRVQCKGKACTFFPEEVCSMILAKMKQIAEFHLQSAVINTVIAIPVAFNHAQRLAVTHAAFIADLNVVRLISAPAAVSLVYNFNRMSGYNNLLNNITRRFIGGEPEEYNVLIFDLGAGTLDVSLVSIRENMCTVQATAGEPHLGGENFDKQLMDHLRIIILNRHRKDIRNQKRTMSRLRAACEQAKIALSDRKKVPIDVSLADGTCFKTIITRAEFDDLNKDLAWKCVLTVHACLTEARIDKSMVKDVILVGGSAVNPAVQFQLWHYFDGKKDFNMKNNLEAAVVYGASLQGFLLSVENYEKPNNVSLIDATSFSFGIKTANGVISEMIPKNTKIPTKKTTWFYNYHSDSRNLVIEVYESDGSSTRENNLLTKFELLGDVGPSQKSASMCTCSVCFEIDASGILTVSAEDTNCGHENRVTIGSINCNSPRLENAKKKVWEAMREVVGKMLSSGNVTISSTKEEDVAPMITTTQQGTIERDKGQGSSEVEEKGEVALGIDLGTSCSCVGVWRRGRVEIIANEYGGRTSLSCVAFTENGRLIGDAAKQQLAMNSTNTIINVRRLIGGHILDPNVQNDIKTLLPFEVKEGRSGRPAIVVQYKGEEKLFTPEELTAMMLRKMKEQAEEHMKTEIKNVVITIPSYFSDSQRKATRDAGLIAGLNVMQLLNEPTAAAITYYLHKTSLESFNKKNILVFDLGGGTFDVSVLAINNGEIQVLAVLGDSNLGGEDFDMNIVNHFVEEFNSKNALKGKDMRNNPRSLRRLRVACERAKRVLSTVANTNIDLDALFEGIDFNTTISKEKFEALNMELISRCIEPVKRCLENAKMDTSNIDDVVLVGGSTRIPMLQQELQRFFNGKELYKSINQDEAVTCGAAVQAAKLSGNYDEKFQGFKIQDVTSISLGIETSGGAMHLLVPRYSIIPVQTKWFFTTRKDDQTEIPIALYECELSRINYKDGLIGEFVMSGIPPQPRGSPKVCVNLSVDSSGILNLSAYDTAESERNEIAIKRVDSRNLTKEEIEEMIRDAEKFKADDDEQKKQAEALNALENFAFRMKEMANNPDVGDLKKKEIEDSADETLNWLEAQHNTKIEEINERKQQLERLCNQENKNN